MNTARISQAVRDIDRNTAALKWLEEFGVQLDGRDKAAVSVCIRPHFAGSCDGAKEAAEILEAYALLDIDTLVATAIRNCRNTIDMARKSIIEEAARTSPTDGGDQ